ncbi:unnamed protein product [Microthlaspi erraticum]|uniref:Uncharacterized protein n=1 Tax=Microthlaspi erraticum TaxID=1685480 RepID=A0A6D2HS97_9BRAS|nr:unnamed protein product [Microthlaspi erraticum]
MVYRQEKELQQLCMKIMLLASHNSRMDTSKETRTKHILPKFFFTHELQKNGDVSVHQIRSSENLADFFTKALPTSTFKKLTHIIGLHRLKDLSGCPHERK